MQYANKAILELTSTEDKARATFLLAKCWQKSCPSNLDYVQNGITNPYFNLLATKFNQTKMQEMAFQTCSYYSMFLNGK
jgi:hypothetical protein